MRIVENEKGGLLVYAIFLVLFISVITVPLLNISSTRTLTDVRDKNQKIATNLAVSAVEQYLQYLTSCDNPCTEMDRYKTKYFINGITEAPRPMSITLADETPVTFTMYYQQDPTTGVKVITRVVAGDTNHDGIANEKNAGMKEIVYNLNGKVIVTKMINPGSRTEVPELFPPSQKIYLDTGTMGNTGSLSDPQKVSQLQTALTNYLNQRSHNYEEMIAEYKKSTNTCSNTTCINSTIQSATSEPVVIKLSSTKLSSFNNNTGKKVVFVFDTFSTNFSGSNVDIVANHLNLPSSFTLTNGNLLIGNSVELTNQSTITIHNGSLYAKNFNPSKDNGISITADNFVVSDTFDIKNNANLDIKNEFVVGNIKVGNNATLECTAGDFFVASEFRTGNNSSLTAGGSIAIGGNVNVGSLKVQVGGGTTILNPSVAESGGETTESEEIVWLPSRQ